MSRIGLAEYITFFTSLEKLKCIRFIRKYALHCKWSILIMFRIGFVKYIGISNLPFATSLFSFSFCPRFPQVETGSHRLWNSFWISFLSMNTQIIIMLYSFHYSLPNLLEHYETYARSFCSPLSYLRLMLKLTIG